MAKQISENEFGELVLEAEGLVLVDFFAVWCGPCKMMSPVLDEVAGELDGVAAVYKVDIDRECRLAQRFEIMSIPTMIVFSGGEPVRRFVGVQPKQVLFDALSG